MAAPDDPRREIGSDTIAISLMHANSEVGTLQPITAIGQVAREHGVPLHVDAVQTFGKIPLDVDALGIDALSFSSHKIYGPKGVARSEEHTSELQSLAYLVCRLLLEKKKLKSTPH